MKIPRVVSVEDQSSREWHEVDTKTWACSCRSLRESCSHIRRARDVHLHKCERSRWEFASAMHKEIRRGDVAAAVYWADLLARVSPSYVEFYAKQITGEETRNLHLMRATFRGNTAWTYRDWVAAIAGSRKRWEGADQRQLFAWQMRGYAGFDADDGIKDQRTSRQILSDGLVAEDRAAVFLALNWFYSDEVTSKKPAAEVWSPFIELMAPRASATLGGLDFADLAREFSRVTRRDAYEIRVMMIEGAFGAWSEFMNEYPHAADIAPVVSDGSRLIAVPEYAYDEHVAAGRRRVAALFSRLRPGEQSPENLDLRWSGGMLGLAWRYAAYAQFGAEYCSQPWEAVEWGDEYWELALAYDRAG